MYIIAYNHKIKLQQDDIISIVGVYLNCSLHVYAHVHST